MEYNEQDEIKNLEKYTQALKKFKNLTALAPFRASHRYVDDRRGNTLIECNSDHIAKVLAELLNCLPNPEIFKHLVIEKEVVKEAIKEVKNSSVVELTPSQKYKKLL